MKEAICSCKIINCTHKNINFKRHFIALNIKHVKEEKNPTIKMTMRIFSIIDKITYSKFIHKEKINPTIIYLKFTYILVLIKKKKSCQNSIHFKFGNLTYDLKLF